MTVGRFFGGARHPPPPDIQLALHPGTATLGFFSVAESHAHGPRAAIPQKDGGARGKGAKGTQGGPTPPGGRPATGRAAVHTSAANAETRTRARALSPLETPYAVPRSPPLSPEPFPLAGSSPPPPFSP
jgi:hypothetical protein